MFGWQTSCLKNVQCCNSVAMQPKSFSDESIKIQFWTIQPSERAKTCASTVTMSRIKISQTKRILGFICWNNVQEVNLTCRQLTFSSITVFGPLNTNIPSIMQGSETLSDKNTYMMFDDFNCFLLFIWYQGSLLTWCKTLLVAFQSLTLV